jgi:hypothetical protein
LSTTVDPKAEYRPKTAVAILMAQQMQQAETKTESTTAGEQHVIPGAEKVSDAEVAKRKAGEPLKPKVRQKPADEGLFGDEANQTDLVDLAGRPNAASKLAELSANQRSGMTNRPLRD